MKPYILLYSKFDTLSPAAGVVKTLIGVVDQENPDNTVSLLDILKGNGIQENRLAEVLYNMGLKFRVTNYTATSGNDVYYGFAVTTTVSDEVYAEVYNEAFVDFDIWEYLSETDGSVVPECKDIFVNALRNAGVSYNNDDINAVINRLACDADKVINGQCFGFVSIKQEKPEYSIYCADMPVKVNNITNIMPVVTQAEKMAYPDSEIKLVVPSFLELVCTQNNAIENKKKAFDSIGTEEDDSTQNDFNDTETHLFTNGKNTFTYREIYKPKSMPSAEVTGFSGSYEVPIINTKSINVSSVTQFWEVYPASAIPADAYNRKNDNTRYALEDLTGHNENIHMTLKPNESKYYNKLIHLLTIAVSIEHNALSDKVYESVKNLMSESVEQYCKTLAEQAFNLMWCHTGTTQSVYSETYEDDINNSDDDSSDVIETSFRLHCHYGSVEKDANGIFRFKSALTNFVGGASSEALSKAIRQGLPRLNIGFDGNPEEGFIHHDSALVGYINTSSSNHRWIDALIRLLRWGDRKPSMLTTEDIVTGANRPERYWDLNGMSTSISDGLIENLTPVIDEKTGNKYKLVAVITADIAVTGNTINQYYASYSSIIKHNGSLHVPVGVLLEVKMQENNTYINHCEDIFTYANRVKKGEARGSVIYKDGKFMSYNGESSELIGEIDLSTIVSYLERGTVNDVITETNEQGEIEKSPVMLKFVQTDNAEIIASRSEVAKSCGDARKYASIADKKTLLSAMNEFVGIPANFSVIAAGKNLAEKKTLPNSMLICNLEHARIVYTFLDRIISMAYTPIKHDNDELADIVSIMNCLQDYDLAKEAINNSGSDEEEDKIFTEFYDAVKNSIESFVFLYFKQNGNTHKFVMGISRDKAAKVVLFTSTSDLDKLKKKLGTRASKVTSITKVLDEKYKNSLSKGARIYNRCGKKLDTAIYEIKDCKCIFSSEEAAKGISNFFV